MDAVEDILKHREDDRRLRQNALLRRRLAHATFEALMRELSMLEGFNVAARMHAYAENLQKAPPVS